MYLKFLLGPLLEDALNAYQWGELVCLLHTAFQFVNGDSSQLTTFIGPLRPLPPVSSSVNVGCSSALTGLSLGTFFA